jgi:hypothetical protein
MEANMKKLKYSGITILLIVSFMVILSGCNGGAGGGQYEKYISGIETFRYDANGIPTTGYQVNITQDTDWDKLSKEDRQGIARYGVQKALEKADEDGATNFSVLGARENSEGNNAVFQYDPINNEVVINLSDGSREGSVSLE